MEQSPIHQRRLQTLLYLCGAAVVILALTRTNLFPLLAGLGIVVIAVATLWTVAGDVPRLMRAARAIMISGGVLVALAAIAFMSASRAHNPAVPVVSGSVIGFLLPIAGVLLVAGGMLMNRIATVSTLAIGAFVAIVLVSSRGRSPVRWRPISSARSEALAEHKLILYDFSADWCGPCKLLDREVFGDPKLAARINDRFIPVRVIDRQREDGRNPPDVAALQHRYGVRAFPTIVFADGDLNLQQRVVGFRNKALFASDLDVRPEQPSVPISFRQIGESDWKPYPYAVSLDIAGDSGRTARAMRLDFDFHSATRYAAARKDIDLQLPDDYQFTFWLRADAPVNNLEFKLDDAQGNVWWVNRPDFEFPREWRKVTLRKRDFEYAWGPSGGGQPNRISAIEIVVTAGSGGKGTVWIDDLRLEQVRTGA